MHTAQNQPKCTDFVSYLNNQKIITDTQNQRERERDYMPYIWNKAMSFNLVYSLPLPIPSIIRSIFHSLDWIDRSGEQMKRNREQIDNHGYQHNFCVIGFCFDFHKKMIIQDDWAVAYITIKYNKLYKCLLLNIALSDMSRSISKRVIRNTTKDFS